MAASHDSRTVSRRRFLTSSLLGSAGALVLPTFIPKTYLLGAATPPSRKINVAVIGCGRMGTEDLRGTIVHDLCRVVAVCDLDAKRLEAARSYVETYYKGKGEAVVKVGAYRDYKDVLARPDVDAVIVTPPDHWHGIVAVQAALAGKDIHVQKPLTYDINEAMILRKVVRAKQRILQVGSQQRSSKPWNTFRIATEAVRNGRIGAIKTIKIGIGQDQPSGKPPVAEPVPAHFDYETWLGPAPQQPYMEGRVHPQKDLGRPGWITTEDFGLGMITNWGAHHIDIAHWGMGQELGGPGRVEGRAEFMQNDQWTVHHTYHVEMAYPNGIQVILDHTFPNGIRFEGTEGWVFCARGSAQVTASDPNAASAAATSADTRALQASQPSILTSPLPADAVRWAPSESHYLNWLEAIAARKDPIAPVDQAARSLEACAVAWIAMKLQRPLRWDAQAERFIDDAPANALCARQPRSATYDITAMAKQAGF